MHRKIAKALLLPSSSVSLMGGLPVAAGMRFAASKNEVVRKNRPPRSLTRQQSNGLRKKPLKEVNHTHGLLAKVTRPAKGKSAQIPSIDKVRKGGSKTQMSEDARMSENDIRLAMRMLMNRHFSQTSSARRLEDSKQDEERRRIQQLQKQSLDRIAEKTRNAMRLLGSDSNAVGDGVLPLFTKTRSNPYVVQRRGPSASWKELNPVSCTEGMENVYRAAQDIDFEDDPDFPTNLSLQVLCKPDLSFYDSENDHRISSEEAVRQDIAGDRGQPPLRVAGTFSTATSLASFHNTLKLTTQEEAQDSNYHGEEDADAFISAYSDGLEDDV